MSQRKASEDTRHATAASSVSFPPPLNPLAARLIEHGSAQGMTA